MKVSREPLTLGAEIICQDYPPGILPLATSICSSVGITPFTLWFDLYLRRMASISPVWMLFQHRDRRQSCGPELRVCNQPQPCSNSLSHLHSLHPPTSTKYRSEECFLSLERAAVLMGMQAGSTLTALQTEDATRFYTVE